MSATIIAFPTRPQTVERQALMGDHLRGAFAPPPRDPELALLVQIAESLLSNVTDEGCDRFLDRLAAWEAANAG